MKFYLSSRDRQSGGVVTGSGRDHSKATLPVWSSSSLSVCLGQQHRVATSIHRTLAVSSGMSASVCLRVPFFLDIGPPFFTPVDAFQNLKQDSFKKSYFAAQAGLEFVVLLTAS